MTRKLETMNLVKRYDGRAVVNGVDLEVETGEIVGLLGPNGAGKTTTFQIIVGLTAPDEGSVWLAGEEITNLPMYRRSKKGLGYLPQEPSVFRNLTVRQNLMAILELIEDDAAERERRCRELIDDFHLAQVAQSIGLSLSGGERRRVEIARALIPGPSFLLLDEPFAGVDPIAVEEVQEMILMLSERGIGVLITDHNVRETLAITDHSYIMNQGDVLVSGDAETLVNDEEARSVYLGSSFSIDQPGRDVPGG